MINQKWLLIGQDTRLEILQKLMLREGRDCVLIETDVYTERLKEVLLTFQPSHIVFSVLQLKNDIPVNLFRQDVKLFVGLASNEWLAPLKEAGLDVQSYLTEETFLWENARITAEAFVKEFYQEAAETITGQNFLVAGFGRVGKMTADLLYGMGGAVTIMTDVPKELAEAKMRHFPVHPLNAELSFESFYIINTIPTKWLKIDSEPPHFIFDLASSPGCLAEEENLEYYKLLPGLPGKHFPVSAAKALKAALGRMNRI